MSEYANNCGCNNGDAVPIKVNRAFDSCSDKDCITGVQVALTSPVPPSATIVKSRCITVSNVCMNVEPIPFNKGFYSVDITFTFDVQLLAYDRACGTPTFLSGKATVSKSCILYGSETNSKTFSSEGSVIGTTGSCCDTVNPPTALVQVVSPLVLESKIISHRGCDCGCVCTVLTDGDSAERGKPSRGVALTIGLFYVVELIRPVTIMVPTYNYTIPKKECCSETDSPCEVFDKIRFPVEEFSPRISDNSGNGNGCCGCQTMDTFGINPPPIAGEISDDYDCGCSE